MVGSEKLNELELCDYFILGKQPRMKLRSDMHNSNRLFKYVHLNLWSPTRVPTQKDGLYFSL